MRRSYLHLVISSVLLAWALGIAVLILYALGQSWVDERARRDGVFLALELLDQTPAPMRAARLRELQEHFSVDLTLLSRREVERRLGRQIRPGEQIPYKPLVREEWYFLVFHDGQGVLAAGPVNPAIPAGVFPIGLVLMLVFMPVVAAVVVLRVERGLSKVERANQALAVGELSARVDGLRGAPDELAASFNAMAERVERLVRSREELLQAVSHELGSPLSRLRFHMELLADQPVDRRQDRLQAMSRELDALDELVSELLGYVQSDDLRVDKQTFDARQGLADLAELARLEAPEGRAVEVTVEIPEGAEVFADQRLFLRAIENVLRNAVKCARGQVRLELIQEEDHVQVAVHDDGPGIPPEQRERVMAPFFRLEDDRGRTLGGVGLGLAIVNRIVQRHDGRIEIAGSPLGGAKVTTLWLTCGRRQLHAPVVARRSAAPPPEDPERQLRSRSGDEVRAED